MVQGVGFRPSVYRLATTLGLGGWVCNSPDGVIVEVEGPEEAVGRFIVGVQTSLPPLARLTDIEVHAVEPEAEAAFRVLASAEGRRQRALVPPDTALCAECRAEMDDPQDRRHAFAFTTCTNCGPRFSLVRGLPYDRERTAMACFPLCEACEREYTDPGDRRFHAEPVCCPECGPRLWLQDAQGMVADRADAALAAARRALAGGEIVAVKGLGGFQLACDAASDAAVARLRERKRRPAKALAVMVPDLAAAERLVLLSDHGRAALVSPRAPIVLAPRRAGAPLAGGIAPGLDDLGVLLPTTPLHVELFRGAAFAALVMTSGNASDEPICRSNREALARLAPIADAFLLHDRDVVRRVDDSVERDAGDGVVVLRRARGHVPAPLRLPVAAPEPVLALGGYLQATVCLALGREAFPSQHVGDLDAEAARAFLAEVAAGLEEFLDVEARLLVVDEHPDYPSAWLGDRLARMRDGRVLPVQHHLAHAAAVLAEHGRFPGPGETALAVALDGTGWGEDETAWGGEWIELSGELAWRRVARLEPLPLVGGEAAVREPWRVLAAALARRGMADALARLPVAAAVPRERLRQVAELSASGEWAQASGAGRVFEAAGALLGAAAVNSYEGEAAARSEALAASCGEAPARWDVAAVAVGPAGEPVLASSALLAEAAERLLAGEARERVAAGFHAAFAAAAGEITRRVAAGRHARVAVGGGCMVNRLLRRGMAAEFATAGVEALLPARVPPGDGGLSYGQAVLGAAALARRADPRYLGG